MSISVARQITKTLLNPSS